MMTILAWLAFLAGGLVGLVAAMAMVGLLLPRGHVASRSITLPAPPDAVWATITDYPGQPAWHKALTAVDRLEGPGGSEVWRESFGRNHVDLRTGEAISPSRLVRHIDDVTGPFHGRWEYVIEPEAAGSRVTLTEHGVVPNPLFRFVTRYVIGQATFLENYLKALAVRFGGPATVRA